MISTWLHKHESDDLIFFFNGWGMDENPFRHLATTCHDVIIVSDYQTINDHSYFSEIAKKYNSVHLLAWSMGVWQAAQILAGLKDCFDKTIAINGSLQPVHEKFGIDPYWFEQTIDNLDSQTVLKFYKRMCRTQQNIEFFIENRPHRSIESMRKELQQLYIRASNQEDIATSFYSHVVTSDKDFVIPTKNQSVFWKATAAKVTTFSGYHYIFNNFENWEELLTLV